MTIRQIAVNRVLKSRNALDLIRGVLFVDRVTNTKSYMMADEFRKRVVEKQV